MILSKKSGRNRADNWNTPEYQRAIKRLPKMGNEEMLGWLDQALTGMDSYILNYRRDGDIKWLKEIVPHVSVLQAVVEELIIRAEL